MADKTVVFITGANTGLGFETVKAFCASEKAYTILLGGRSIDKARAAVTSVQKEYPQTPSSLVATQIDIEDDNSISQAFEDISSMYGRLDVLINNAGAQFDPLLFAGKLSMREMWDKSWSVNVTSTQILTSTFVPLLLKSSAPRLLFITSGTSTLAETDNLKIPVNRTPAGKGWPKEGFTGVPAYRSSKTGMNMMMREWHRLLKDDGVKVWCISPGMLATGLGIGVEANKANGAEDPALGGRFVKDVVEGARDDDVGLVVRRGNVQPW